MKPNWREFRVILFSPVVMVSCVAMTITSAIAGPFGTFNLLSLPQRFVFWGIITALVAGGIICARCASRRLQNGLSRWQANVLMSFCAAIVCVGLVRWVAALFDKTLMVHFPEFVVLVLLVFFLYLVIFWLQDYLAMRRSGEIRLMRRLSDDKRGPLLRISVKDHYVEVFTVQGVQRLRMRFSDAIEQAEGIDGFCVHRSHWVAREAILSAHRRKGKVVLQLVDGSEVPVSRTYLSNVEDGGWL